MMSTEIGCLALYLDAPLQSWGYQSRFDRRTTLSHPTRSGIVGMMCAAMGIDRFDSARLAEFAELTLTIYTFPQQSRLIDFHTIGGGWDKRTHPSNVVRSADGSPGNTVVTRREYLQWSRFAAIVQGPRRQLEVIAEALRNPQWGIWLGRKSCIPASPVEQGVFDCPDAALGRLRELAAADPVRTVSEAQTFAEGTDTLMDTPLDFGRREFAPRRISVE